MGRKLFNWEGTKSTCQRCLSIWAKVSSEVLQDSVFGPLLFMIDLSDSAEGLEAYLTLFSNNAKLMKEGPSISGCGNLQQGLDKVQQWVGKWVLKVNPNKCKVVKVEKGEGRLHFEHHKEGNELQESNRERDLEIHIMSNLSPENQIRRVVRGTKHILSIVNLPSCAWHGRGDTQMDTHEEYSNLKWRWINSSVASHVHNN